MQVCVVSCIVYQILPNRFVYDGMLCFVSIQDAEIVETVTHSWQDGRLSQRSNTRCSECRFEVLCET